MSAPTMQDLLSGALGGARSEASLQRELVLGFELEHKRKAEDDMKKRAIRTAGSYDEFKNLVAAATQKPIEAKDYGGKALTSMNKCLGGGEAGGAAAALGGAGGGSRASGLGLDFPSTAAAAAAAAAAPVQRVPAPGALATPAGFGLPPNTPGEFERTWRRMSAEQRPAYLAWLGPPRLSHAFRFDIDGSMLGSIVAVLGAPEGAQGPALREEWAGHGGEEALRLRLDLAAGLLLGVSPSALGLAVDTLCAEEKAAAGRLEAAARALGHQVQALQLLIT